MNSATVDHERLAPPSAQPFTGLARLAVVVGGTIGLWAFDTFLDPSLAGTLGPVLVALLALGIVFARRTDARAGLTAQRDNRSRFRRAAPVALLGILAIAVVLKIVLHSEAPLGIAALLDTGFILGALPVYFIDRKRGAPE
jgi:hypothetical protein